MGVFLFATVCGDSIDVLLKFGNVGASIEMASFPIAQCMERMAVETWLPNVIDVSGRMSELIDPSCRRQSGVCRIARPTELSGGRPPAFDRISHPEHAASDDPCRVSAMPAHDVVAARSERLFHP